MGSHTFTWAHAAQEVYVTGTFDNWSKSVKLEKHGDSFHKTVDLPNADKIYYKFVVDGNWVTDHSARQETDPEGNLNNVVESSEISSAPASHTFLSSAAPQSSTAALAGQQPLEKDRHTQPQQAEYEEEEERDFPQETPGGDLPGAFPTTPGNELNSFFARPIPATEGRGNPIKLAPGEPVPDPSTLTSNTIHSTVRDGPELKRSSRASKDHEEQAFGVNPIPATSGIGNPIKLAPGEPVPHPSTLTNNTVQSTVRDGSQYGVSDTGAPVLPPVLDQQDEAEANGAAMFGIPPVGSGLIPESSLPMGDKAFKEPTFEPSFTTSSVAPQSTTAQLAGQVPLEPRGIPEVVSDSQHTAHADPEASSSAEAVQHKNEMESELKRKVHEEPAVAESGTVTGVPDVVADSQHAAHADPEASASSEAVREKAAMENELKKTVSKQGDSIVPEAVAGTAAAAGATLIGAALLAKDKATETYKSTEPAPSARSVPGVVTESQHTAHVNPEASSSPEAVREKAAFEDELKHVVPEAPATSESGILGSSEGGLTGKLAAGATAATAAITGAAYTAKDKAADAYESYAGQPASNIMKEPTVDGSVPSTVLDSQEKAHVAPEASAYPDVVREKAAFEGELQSEVPKAPATSESGAFGSSEQGITGRAAAGIAAGTAALGGAAYAARDKAADTYESYAGQPASTHTRESTTGTSVPETVLDSQERAHVSPEASANPEAVREKSAFERELQAEIPEAPATSESGVLGKSEQGITGKAAAGIAAGTAAVTGAAYSARDKAADTYESYAGQPSSTREPTTGSYDAVPEIVHESQERAHVSPEASANPEAVHEKSAFEHELEAKVPKAPATSESGILGSSEQGITGKAAAGIAAGTAAIGATAAGAAYAARDKTAETTGRDPTSFLPASVQSAIDNMNKQGTLPASMSSDYSDNTTSVPDVVTDSQHAAHVAPEASAQPEVVAEKSEMERELLSRVPQTDEASMPAPTESAALSATAPIHHTSSESRGLGETGFSSSQPTGVAAVSGVPSVTSSLPIRETEATASSSQPTGVVAVDDVKPTTSLSTAVPDEPGVSTSATTFTSSTPIAESFTKQQSPVETETTAASAGLNAPAESQAQTPATKADQLAAPSVPSEQPSRDVSPMTRPDSSKRSEPTTTTGLETSSVPTTSTPTTPQKSASKRTSGFFRGNTPDSNRTGTPEASSSKDSTGGGTIKKRGFLAKLKEKFKS